MLKYFLDIFLLFIFYNIILVCVGLFVKASRVFIIFFQSLYMKLYLFLIFLLFFLVSIMSLLKLFLMYSFIDLIIVAPIFFFDFFFFFFISFFILLFLVFFFFVNFHYKRVLPFILCLNFLLFSNFFYLFVEDFFSLYIVVEFHTLLMYMFYNITLQKYSSYYIKSGVRFFILSVFTSLFFLLGLFFIYYSSGSVVFSELSFIFNDNYNIFFKIGLNIIYGVFCVKLGLFPFYIWMLEIFGTLTNFFFFIYIFLSKIPVFIVMLKLIFFYEVTTLLFIISIFSVIAGTFCVYSETDFRLFIIYSSMVQYGVFFISLTVKNLYIFYGVFYSYLNYLFIISFFFFLVFFFTNNKNYNLNIFISVKYSFFFFNFFLIILLFSVIGVPPTFGFIGKYYLYFGLLSEDSIYLTIFLILINLFSSVYYFNIIRLLFFHNIKDAGFFLYSIPFLLKVYCFLLAFFVLFFFFLFSFFLCI